MTCHETNALGAYLLGALDPGARADFEAHLGRCASCRAELVKLSPLPGLLHRVKPEDFAESVEPTAADLAVAPEDAAPRAGLWRRQRVLLSAAAAVLVLALGAVVGYRVLGEEATEQATQPPAPAVAPVSWTATDPASGVRADVELTIRSWGTEFRIRLKDVPPGKPCKLVVRGRDGDREVAGWWSSGYLTDEQIPGSTSIDLGRISQVQVVTDDDRVLVNIQAPA
ncbi:anti-sigma factor family protein [Actinokineospora pegani]|uniref:anti-sigma factor family protein n=1 Tax=Actinokineospora pegani TaxID=2654637 RepID=UPI0012E9D3E3|nr:zf-HC2 domain-containing protein [Actinokineospora pegani]